MNEAIFPVVGTLLVLFVVLPLIALGVRGALAWVDSQTRAGALGGLDLRYVLLVCSTGVPLAWLVSAGLHQAESGRSPLGCLFDHDMAEFCLEPGFFALVLALAAGVSILLHLRRPPHRPADHPAQHSPSRAARDSALTHRLAEVMRQNPRLAELQERVTLTGSPTALVTQGWLRPRICIGAEFARDLTDDMLTAALLHEAEHARLFDPLRFALLRLAISANPLGRWLLAAPLARFGAAREAACDRQAVLDGANPLALAEAIVRAARPANWSVALGAKDTAVLRLRIDLLLAFTESAPTRRPRADARGLVIALGLLVGACLLPHQAGADALNLLHSAAESALLPSLLFQP